MSSRFFAVSDSDSDSSSSSSSSNSSNSHPPSAHSPSSSDDEEEEDEQQQTKTKQKPQTLQQKRKTEVANTLTTVENALKINDFIPILPAIETLFKNALTHASLRTLKNVERGTEMEKEKVKKMNANNARALNACKQKMRKWMKENVKVVEELEKVRKIHTKAKEKGRCQAAIITTSYGKSVDSVKCDVEDCYHSQEVDQEWYRRVKSSCATSVITCLCIRLISYRCSRLLIAQYHRRSRFPKRKKNNRTRKLKKLPQLPRRQRKL